MAISTSPPSAQPDAARQARFLTATNTGPFPAGAYRPTTRFRLLRSVLFRSAASRLVYRRYARKRRSGESNLQERQRDLDADQQADARKVYCSLIDRATLCGWLPEVVSLALTTTEKTAMNPIWKSPHCIASALALSVVLAGCASGPKPPSPELQQQIEAARTSTDHEALAAHYVRQAAGARAIAAEHRRMAITYARMGPSGRGGATMPAHCNVIANAQDGIAAAYDGMAADHRQLAGQAKP